MLGCPKARAAKSKANKYLHSECELKCTRSCYSAKSVFQPYLRPQHARSISTSQTINQRARSEVNQLISISSIEMSASTSSN